MICIFASDGEVLPWQRLNLGKPAFCGFIVSISTETQFRPSQFQWRNNGLSTITDPTRMVVMGAALHALGTEWSAKLDDMSQRANKSLVRKCRYVEKVKLADLWVTINVNSFNLVGSLLLTAGERQGQGVYSASWGPTLKQIACLRAPNSLACLQHSKRPRPFFQ